MESTFYPYLGALGWTGLFLLIGTIIRAKVKFFQTFLFPASLIGGIIGFFVLNAAWAAPMRPLQPAARWLSPACPAVAALCRLTT